MPQPKQMFGQAAHPSDVITLDDITLDTIDCAIEQHEWHLMLLQICANFVVSDWGGFAPQSLYVAYISAATSHPIGLG